MRTLNTVLQHDNVAVRLLRGIFGLTSLVTVGVNVYLQVDRYGSTDLGNYFSYFTIQSNIIIAVILIVGATRPRSSLPDWWDDLRGAAALYIGVTGIVFALFLSNLSAEVGTSDQWVNWVLHDLTPVVGVLDWLLIRSQGRARRLRFVWWLVYPVVYLVFTLARGRLVGWYPYPFIDPTLPGGYSRLIGSTGLVVIVIVLVALIIDILGRLRDRLGPRDRAGSEPLRIGS